MSPEIWLQEVWTGPLPWEGEIWAPNIHAHGRQITRLVVLCALSSMNGGPNARVWGVQTMEGLYGRQGLHQNEVHVLMKLSAFMEGLLIGREDPSDAGRITTLIKNELARVRTQHESLRTTIATPSTVETP
jgi:hypothetical protein